MRADIKERWVAALRSGEYEQTTNALQRVPGRWDNGRVGYCCLGVLCDLAEKDGVTERVGVTESGIVKYKSDGEFEDYETSVPPVPVVQWADLPEANPDIDVLTTRTTSLATLNDNGLTFPQIADFIEHQL